MTPALVYLQSPGSVRGVSDIGTSLDLIVTPPAVIVEFAGESAGAPLVVGLPQRQLCRLNWDLFCIAQSFSSSGGGRLDDGSEKGTYTILDDVFLSLEAYALPSQQSLFASKMFYKGSGRYTLTASSVVYRSMWYCDVIRQGP